MLVYTLDLHLGFVLPIIIHSFIRLIGPATANLQPPTLLRLERQYRRPKLQWVALPHHHVTAPLQA